MLRGKMGRQEMTLATRNQPDRLHVTAWSSFSYRLKMTFRQWFLGSKTKSQMEPALHQEGMDDVDTIGYKGFKIHHNADS